LLFLDASRFSRIWGVAKVRYINVAAVFFGGRLLAFIKNTGGIRPIAIGN